MLDESLQRSQILLSDIQNSEVRYEQLREQNEILRNNYDQLMTVRSRLSSFAFPSIDSFR